MKVMISREEIENLAQLARLELSEEEIISLQKDISSILDYVGQVSAFSGNDGEKKVPLNHNVMREDVPYLAGSVLAHKREAILEALPRREGDYMVVRKIIQKDE
jgi:aspartyl-tRNA(Asn)/glutamyl-tRNA(Gln) amidotransferase subunit C